MGWKTWRRPTLPRLKPQYHGRWGFSRPSSGWDRVYSPRHGHQVVQPIRWIAGWRPATWEGERGSGLCVVCRLGMISVHGACGHGLCSWCGHGVVIEPIGRLGPVSYARYRACTSGLST